MHLSKRLRMVADCVTEGNRVADIGCDHAYLSIYLVKNHIVSFAAAMDVNQGPLVHARENVTKYGVEEQVDIRLSDGLDQLLPDEADTIVMAGMGGSLMVSILQNGQECVKRVNELVLQPQSEAYKVRRYVAAIGFRIVYEDMCIDDGKYYVVIKAIRDHNRNIEAQDCTYDTLTAEDVYGGFLLSKRHNILHTYLSKEQISIRSIQEELKRHPTENSLKRLSQCKEDEERLLQALAYYNA